MLDHGIALKVLPQRIQKLLTDEGVDDNGDGVLGVNELEDMVTAHLSQKKARAKGKISIAGLPSDVLASFDVDGDGTIDLKELHRAGELYAGKHSRPTTHKSPRRGKTRCFDLVLTRMMMLSVNTFSSPRTQIRSEPKRG